MQVLVLENGRYVTSVYEETEKAPVSVLNNFKIDLKAVFGE